MNYDAVMFDLDGTLADTLADIAGAANHVMPELGRPEIELARFRYLAGQGLEYLIRHALPSEDPAEIERGMAIFKAYYAEHSMDHTGPYAGVPALLDALVAANVPMAVLSNKPHAATLALMAHAFSPWPFAAILGHRDAAPLKPDPSSAIEIADTLGIEPQRWAYVGDTRVDMETAKGAGMFAVGVLWGFRDEPELREAGADAIIRHPAELLRLIGTHAQQS